MLFGANIWNWQTGKVAIGGLTSVRYYFPPQAGVPASWPELPAGLVGIVSFRPDLAEVVTGQLDAQILAFLKTAPAGSWVTIWHEANAPKKHILPSAYVAACIHVRRLVQANHLPIHFVQILETYPVTAKGQDLTVWVAPGTYAILLDGFQLADESPVDVFGAAMSAIAQRSPRSHVGIAETNSLTSPDAWAAQAYAFAEHFGMISFAFFAQDESAPPPTFPALPSDEVLAQTARFAAQA